MALSPQETIELAGAKAPAAPSETELEQYIRSIDEHLVASTRNTGIVGCIWGVPRVCSSALVKAIRGAYEEKGWIVGGFSDNTGYNLEFRQVVTDLSRIQG